MEYPQSRVSPRSFGRVIADTFRIFGQDFARFVGTAAIAVLPATLCSGVMWAVAAFARTHADGWTELPRTLVTSYMYPVGTVLLSLLIYPLVQGALIHAASERILGRPVGIGRAYGAAWRRIPDLVVVALLCGFLVLLMAMSLPCLVFGLWLDIDWLLVLAAVSAIGLPFGIYFGIKWLLVLQVAVLEGLGPVEALVRSGRLVTGYWWRVLGIVAVVGLVMLAADAAIYALFLLLWQGSVEQVFLRSAIQGVLFIPLSLVAYTLIYHDLRARKEQVVAPVAAGIDGRTPAVSSAERPANAGRGRKKPLLIGAAVVVVVLVAITASVLLFIQGETDYDSIDVSVEQLSSGMMLELKGGALEEIAYTDFAFVVDFNGSVEAGDEEDSVEAYVKFGESRRYVSARVGVFAGGGTVAGFQTAAYPSTPEHEPDNKVATRVDILDAERILVSPISGDFPGGSQIVLYLDFGDGSGYVERVFTL